MELLVIFAGFVLALVLTFALPWLCGFISGYFVGRRKGRKEILHQRDRMEELARKQYGRFEEEHERANAAVGRAERAEFELKKNKKSKVKRLGQDEWPEIVGETNDDDVPTIG